MRVRACMHDAFRFALHCNVGVIQRRFIILKIPPPRSHTSAKVSFRGKYSLASSPLQNLDSRSSSYIYIWVYSYKERKQNNQQNHKCFTHTRIVRHPSWVKEKKKCSLVAAEKRREFRSCRRQTQTKDTRARTRRLGTDLID